MLAEASWRTVRCTAALAAFLLLTMACATRGRVAGESAAPVPAAPAAGVPADHVKDKDGVLHKRGYKTPFGDCTSCHGQQLRGEGRAPSCYRCHGQKWH